MSGAIVAAAVVGAVAAGYTAYESHQAGKEQKKQAERAEFSAREAQAKQEKIAIADKKASDLALKEQQQKMMKGTSGRTGLLFGSELGTEDKKTTLGA
jgi:hypothetical protein